MNGQRLPSFFLSLCLHLGVAMLVIFWPASQPKPPELMPLQINGLITLGKEGRAASSQGQTAGSQQSKTPAAKPKPEEGTKVAAAQPPAKPEPKPEAKPAPKPEPKPEAIPIPKEPEKQKPQKKPPESNATQKKPPDPKSAQNKKPPEKETPKKDPQAKPDSKAAQQGKKSSLEDALLALSKETGPSAKGGASSSGKGQGVDAAMKALEKEFGGSGDDAQGDGPGGRGGDGRGVPGAYLDMIFSRVKPHFSWAGRADRAKYRAKVNIDIARDGRILARRLVESSGNALYDAAVLSALDQTEDLEPPPRPDLMNIDVYFSPDDISGR